MNTDATTARAIAAQKPGSKLYTAGQIASALNRTKQAVRASVAGVASSGEVEVKGQDAKGWLLAALPQPLWQALEARRKQRGYKSIEAMLDDLPQSWTPPRAFNDLLENARAEAMQWRDVLADLLARQHHTLLGDVLAAGISAACKIFGREISEATFRRHFDLAVERDQCLEQWQRVDLYVSEAAYQSPTAPEAGVQTSAIETPAPIAWPGLSDALASLDDKQKPTLGDRAFLFDSAFRRIEELLEASPNLRLAVLKREFTKLLLQCMPALAKTESAFLRSLERKFTHWRTNGRTQECIEDQRPEKSGAEHVKLCPACRKSIIDAAVDLDRNVSQASRRMYMENRFCASCAAQSKFNVRINKSYVRASIRDDIRHDVEVALIERHGPKARRLASPSVSRDWSDIGPGEVFVADDVTWNHAFFNNLGPLVWANDQTGRPYIGRGECLFVVDARCDYPVGHLTISGEVDPNTGEQMAARYGGEHVRLLILRAHDSVGLPQRGGQILFENSVWRSRLVVGKKVRGWNFNRWRNIESGLNDPRIGLRIRHALPGNPRSKIIERVIGALQERMRPQAGFLGFNERSDKRELMQDFISRARRGLEHPGNELLSMVEFSALLDREMMEFAKEPQNGKRLPGVSPEEAWIHGIDGKSGVATRPLRKLDPIDRALLSTHERELRVTSRGLLFRIGSRQFNFWGDELVKWQHRDLRVAFHIEQPDLLTCFPPDADPFIVKAKVLPSNTASREQLAEVSAARHRWMKHGKVIYDNLPHALKFTVTRTNEQDDQTRAELAFSVNSEQQHREEQRRQSSTENRITKLAATLSVAAPVSRNPVRAAQQEAAAKRMAVRHAKTPDIELPQLEAEP